MQHHSTLALERSKLELVRKLELEHKRELARRQERKLAQGHSKDLHALL